MFCIATCVGYPDVKLTRTPIKFIFMGVRKEVRKEVEVNQINHENYRLWPGKEAYQHANNSSKTQSYQ
jgi:hypothetical protein